ncbi:Rossmann-fold NAD(P)-binding domain-containing protein [Actinokineospora pegani]|uniref:hypothetical protein n=1 Tax=Actinokineospora pegani TaxID=2654637 RepID=UPI0012EA0805|nr:hypothetical protein [Actinokineospora pegani]
MRALVIGGTGLLSGVAVELAGRGWRVVLPSRRPDPGVASGVRWVSAGWSAPDPRLPARLATALGGPADLVVVWAHGGLHGPMADNILPLLADDAPIVELHSGVSCPVAEHPGHPKHRVLLGLVDYAGRTRRLSPAETTEATLAAVDRATDGKLPSTHQVGMPKLLAS